MIKRIGFSVAFSIICLPFFAYAGGPASPQPPVLSTKPVHVTHFKNIHAKGYFKIVLVTSPAIKSPRVLETAYPDSPIQTYVEGDTLVITGASVPRPGEQEPIVKIRTNEVEQVTLMGATDFSAKNMRSGSGLQLNVFGFGDVNIVGKAVLLNEIRQVGASRINIEWMKSHDLQMTLHGGKLRLAGVADEVDARVMGYATVDATYLRAADFSIKTTEHATAHVTATKNLRAFAVGSSNILYYKQPQHITRYSTQSANVLQMAWHN